MLTTLHIEGGLLVPADVVEGEDATRAVAGSRVPYLDAAVPLAASAWASRMARACREYRSAGRGTVAWVALDEEGYPVGALVAKVAAPRAMIAYWVTESRRGQGWGYRQALAAVGWLQGEGIGEVLADTEPENEASARLLRSLGFREAESTPAARRWRLPLDSE